MKKKLLTIIPKGWTRSESEDGLVIQNSEGFKMRWVSADQYKFYFDGKVKKKRKKSLKKYGGFWMSLDAVSECKGELKLVPKTHSEYHPFEGGSKEKTKELVKKFNRENTGVVLAAIPNGAMYLERMRWCRLTSKDICLFVR